MLLTESGSAVIHKSTAFYFESTPAQMLEMLAWSACAALPAFDPSLRCEGANENTPIPSYFGFLRPTVAARAINLGNARIIEP